MKKIEDSIRILQLLRQIDEGTPISEKDRKKLLDVRNLSLKGLNLTSLPESIGLLINLSILDVSKNQIILLPKTIGNLTQLQELDVSDNQLNEFPESIAKLTNLDTLLVFNNNLTILPDFFMKLNKLRVLDFSNNEIASLPDGFSVLHSLEMLSCSTNRISLLPDSIGNLYNLSVLDLSNNPIYRLPYSIGELKELRYMDLSRLHLHSIPEAILDCGLDFRFDQDEYIEEGGILLKDTILDTQPILLFSENRESIINYYNSEHMEINYANVFFLGDGGVGKTFIINHLWMNKNGNETFQTIGINCIRRREVCDNKEVVLSIWDFGGQEIYHSLYSMFLKTTPVMLLFLAVEAIKIKEILTFG